MIFFPLSCSLTAFQSVVFYCFWSTYVELAVFTIHTYLYVGFMQWVIEMHM